MPPLYTGTSYKYGDGWGIWGWLKFWKPLTMYCCTCSCPLLVPSLPLALCGFLNSFRYHVYRSIGCFFSPFFLSFEKRKKEQVVWLFICHLLMQMHQKNCMRWMRILSSRNSLLVNHHIFRGCARCKQLSLSREGNCVGVNHALERPRALVIGIVYCGCQMVLYRVLNTQLKRHAALLSGVFSVNRCIWLSYVP